MCGPYPGRTFSVRRGEGQFRLDPAHLGRGFSGRFRIAPLHGVDTATPQARLSRPIAATLSSSPARCVSRMFQQAHVESSAARQVRMMLVQRPPQRPVYSREIPCRLGREGYQFPPAEKPHDSIAARIAILSNRTVEADRLLMITYPMACVRSIVSRRARSLLDPRPAGGLRWKPPNARKPLWAVRNLLR